jgi:hypothetical protein
MTIDFHPRYRPTPVLPDAEGKALLNELSELACFDFDNKGNAVESGSRAWRRGKADLDRALIKALARFEQYEEFAAWLSRNDCEHVEYHACRLHERSNNLTIK